MKHSENSQVIILLTAGFGARVNSQFPPLNFGEWNGLRRWLHSNDLEPRHLLADGGENLLLEYGNSNLEFARIRALLERSGAMAVAMERWNRAGLWVCTEYDEAYPDRIKQLLKDEAPSLFFGSGKSSLLGRYGVGIVCDVSGRKDDSGFAEDLGRKCAEQDILLGSSMFDGECGRAIGATLENEGPALVITSGKLMSISLNARFRKHIASGNLVMVSASDPEAAPDKDSVRMANRLIHCMSQSVIILTNLSSNGTLYDCAMQNLANGWSTIWIRPEYSNHSVSCDLLVNGAHVLHGGIESIDLSKLNDPVTLETPSDTHQHCEPLSGTPSRDIFYELFLEKLRLLSLNNACDISRLSVEMRLCETQLMVWLNRAVDQGLIREVGLSGKYRWISPAPKQDTMFP